MERKIAIIGIPMDLGQSRRGVDMGPSAIRYAGLHHCLKQLDYTVEDLGNIYIEQSNEEKQLIKSESSQNLRNLNQVVRASETLAYLVDQVMKQDKLPLILGGDHSISIGSIAGISNHYDQLGVIWFDAHGDMNREDTSPSGNIHGMPLAVNLGYGHHRLINVFKNNRKVLSGNVVVIGVRALDEGEKQFIKEHDIKMYTMHEIDRLGMTQVITETVDYLKAKTDGVHVSFDLDC